VLTLPGGGTTQRGGAVWFVYRKLIVHGLVPVSPEQAARLLAR
jgi:hypothetical protein